MVSAFREMKILDFASSCRLFTEKGAVFRCPLHPKEKFTLKLMSNFVFNLLLFYHNFSCLAIGSLHDEDTLVADICQFAA